MFNVVFFHVGPDIKMPAILVSSIRKHNSSVRIIQATDLKSPRVEGTDEVLRFDGNVDSIMLFRMECYAKIETSVPTWFLDTDMICLKSLDLPDFHEETRIVAILKREFNLDARLPRQANGVDLSRYRERPIGEVFPYVGCVVFLRNSDFWKECVQEYYKLDSSLGGWWGDQEALKRVAKRKNRINRLNSILPIFGKTETVIELPETSYACLPEFENSREKPFLLHFKGPRKSALDEYCRREQLSEKTC